MRSNKFPYMSNSFEFKSRGVLLKILTDKPKRTFIQLLKKKIGPSKYKKSNKKTHKRGKRSKKKLKNKNSAIKKIDPGKPKKIKQFSKDIKNSLGHKKLTPLISVVRRVLKRRLTASTNKKEFAESRA